MKINGTFGMRSKSTRLVSKPVFLLYLMIGIMVSTLCLKAETTINFNSLGIITDTTLQVNICEGDTYEFNGESLVSSGTYAATFIAQDGSDSTVILELNVNPTYDLFLSETICEGSGYELGGVEYFDPGVYTVTMTSSLGCDSTVTLSLEVLFHSLTLLNETVCENVGYSLNGEILTESGVYTSVLPAANGCDSLIVLELTALSSPVNNQVITICPGTSYVFEGEEYTEAGVYSFTYTGQNGCDSVVQLSLHVGNLDTIYLTTQICEGSSYSYNGDILTEEGTYSYLFTSSAGCDSVVYLTVEWLPLGLNLISVRQCPGTSYQFNGEEIQETGVYTQLSVGNNGCDSLTVLDISFSTPLETNIQATICSNESFVFQGMELSTAGLYIDTLTSLLGGCDSIVYLQLSVNPAPQIELTAEICSGDSYDFYGSTFTEAGTYQLYLPASEGCDTLAVLILNVGPPISTAIGVTICEGDFFNYGGQQLNTAGLYPFNFISQQGCDSIVTINLSVLPRAISTLTVETCEASYLFLNEELSESGTYLFTLENAASNGCDSLIELNLTLLQSSATTLIDARICEGEDYPFGGIFLTQPGTYIDSMQNNQGCDSIVVLVLRVISIELELIEFEGSIIAPSIDGASFQWVDCNTQQLIPNANQQQFTPESSGSYAVIATVGNCSDTSACTTIVVASDNQKTNNKPTFSVYPNPATDHIYISASMDIPAETELTIVNLFGTPLLRKYTDIEQNNVLIDVSSLVPGHYILYIANSEKTYTQPIVIN